MESIRTAALRSDILLKTAEDSAPQTPPIIDIRPDERAALMNTAKQLMLEFGHYENPEYISSLHLYAYQLLPSRLARKLTQFSTDFSATQYGALIFRGLVEVDQQELGPTPANWRMVEKGKLNIYGFICSLLHGAVPAKPVQYYVQRQGGGLLHAIIPDERMCYSQTGSGSRTDLFVHTEDAFLFNAADFLSFLYLRNEEQVNSTLYSIRSHPTITPDMQRLFEPIFKCPKDANFDQEEATAADVCTSVLYGSRQAPFIRFDAAEQLYNESANQHPEALDLLHRFWEEAKKYVYSSYIPQSGDLIFVNNHLCAHGRTAFQAGYKLHNGQLVPCERRQMLRMMSKTSLIHIREVTHPDDPYFVMEDHYGKVVELTNLPNR
ncbi:hypothetical protein [Olivibacter jilunii]|uniref:hypothetical protein n=1 Tax=Olivibacter jilunii TaxID=985016 RepID=UPI003F134C74